jgi:hypothetical protein
MTVLVAKFKNKRDAQLAASFIENMKEKVEIMKEENWEDFYLAQLIDEGMKEKGEVPLERIRKKLRK